MAIKHLSAPDAIALLEIIQESLICRSAEQLRQLVQRLRALIPYQAAISGISTSCGAGRQPLERLTIVNIDYPEPYMAELVKRGLIAHDPIVDQHFRAFRKLYWADNRICRARPCSGPVHELLSLAEDFGFSKVRNGCGYSDGVRSPRDSSGSLFCFHSLERSQRTEEVLGLVIPHLHQALRRVASLQEIRVELSPREREILQWVKQGKTNWEISHILSISERTVKFHLGNLCQKLGATSRAHAVAIALEQGFLDLE